MNSFIKKSYFKDVVVVVLYLFLIFYAFVFYAKTDYADTSLMCFQRIGVLVALALLIWYNVVYVKANKKK